MGREPSKITGLEQMKLLREILHVGSFSVEDLVESTGAKPSTVRTVLRRHAECFELVGTKQPASRGGQYQLRRVIPGREGILRAKLELAYHAAAPAGPELAPPPEAMESPTPDPAEVEAALLNVRHLLLRRFEEASEGEEREHVLRLAAIGLRGLRQRHRFGPDRDDDPIADAVALLEALLVLRRRLDRDADPALVGSFGAVISGLLSGAKEPVREEPLHLATGLADTIHERSRRLVAAGASAADLERGIHRAIDVAVAQIKGQSRPARERAEIAELVALAAPGDDEIGGRLTEAVSLVGNEGAITVEEGGTSTELEVHAGMRLDCGYLSPCFVTDRDRMEVTLDEPYVLVHEESVSDPKPLLPVLEEVARSGRPLLVVAEDVAGEALSTFVANKLRGALDVCAVKAPGGLRQIIALTGGKVVNAGATLADLGRAHKVTVDAHHTTIIGDASAPARGGVAVLRVGAPTAGERREKKSRAEGALEAIRAGLEQGVFEDARQALLRCVESLRALRLAGDERRGAEIVREAIEEMANGAEGSGAVVPAQLVGEALQEVASKATLLADVAVPAGPARARGEKDPSREA